MMHRPLLVGGVDLHAHPGPSPFTRRMSIMDADAATVGFRALVCKSHHHSMQSDILGLEPVGLRETGVRVVGGVALNRTVGGLNPYAVELALRMGGRVVWFPTIASSAHIEFHAAHHSGFPVSGIPLRDNEPISILDGAGWSRRCTTSWRSSPPSRPSSTAATSRPPRSTCWCRPPWPPGSSGW